jgi:8-oxo-dGTP pyrophosphatase MutT (NUDIX family)
MAITARQPPFKSDLMTLKPQSLVPRPLPVWDDAKTDAARPDWVAHSKDVVFETPWIRVEHYSVTAPTGKPGIYGMICFTNQAVGVFPLFDDGTVALVGQKRFVLGAYSWEMPEGGVPHDETPEAGGRRELREETGLEAARFEKILEMDLSNSVCDEAATVFLATGLTQAETEMDDTEIIEYARLPFKDVLEAVIRGQIRDSMTVAAVYRVHHMAASGALEADLAKIILS